MFFRNGKLIMILMVTSLLLIVTACSNDSSGEDEEAVDPDAEELSASEREATIGGDGPEQTYLSDALENDIWYSIRLREGNNIAKDSRVKGILVIKDGLATKYGEPFSIKDPDKTHFELQDLVGFTDEEIMDHISDESNIKHTDSSYYNEPYYLKMITDDTGNNARLVYFSPENINSQVLGFEHPIEGEILSEYFDGFNYPKYDEAMVKRVEKNEAGQVIFDDPSTDKEYIEVE